MSTMSLELRQSLSLRQEQRLTLRQSQRQLLRQALALQLVLRKPAPVDAVRGLQGMENADCVLRRHGGVGVLIGGVATDIWRTETTSKSLAEHKDVDVLVVGDGIPCERFEGGIDWWLPRVENMNLHSDASLIEGAEVRFWENGNSVKLSYGVTLDGEVEPGLYIPDRDFRIELFLAEVAPYLTPGLAMDDDVEGVFRRRYRKQLKRTLPKKFRAAWASRVIQESGVNEEIGFRSTALQREAFLALQGEEYIERSWKAARTVLEELDCSDEERAQREREAAIAEARSRYSTLREAVEIQSSAFSLAREIQMRVNAAIVHARRDPMRAFTLANERLDMSQLEALLHIANEGVDSTRRTTSEARS